MTDRTFEDRVRLRTHAEITGPLLTDINGMTRELPFATYQEAARVAAVEHLDTIDPLDTHPRIAIARPALDLGDPDLDELRAVGWEKK